MLILTTTFDCKASLSHVYDYYDGSDSIQILLTTCERMCSRVCAAALFSRRCGGHPVVTVISYALRLLTREEASAGVRSGRESSAGIDFLPQGPCTVPAGQLGHLPVRTTLDEGTLCLKPQGTLLRREPSEGKNRQDRPSGARRGRGSTLWGSKEGLAAGAEAPSTPQRGRHPLVVSLASVLF